MDLNEADFKAKVRRKLGGPSVQELPVTIIDDAYNDAIKDYTKVRPIRTAVLLTLSSSVENYILSPAPFLVLDVIPTAPLTAAGRLLGPEFAGGYIDMVNFHMPDFQEYFSRVSQYRDMFEDIYWEYTPPSLYITPTPLYQVNTLVIGGNKPTLLQIPNNDEELLIRGTMGYAYDTWSNQRDALSTMSVPSGSGTVTLENGERLKKKSEENLLWFRERLGWNRPSLHQG